METLTEGTKEYFGLLVNDASNWSGTPAIHQTYRGEADKGHLTDLKKRGLLATWYDDEIDATFVEFTDSGCALAKELFGINPKEY